MFNLRSELINRFVQQISRARRQIQFRLQQTEKLPRSFISTRAFQCDFYFLHNKCAFFQNYFKSNDGFVVVELAFSALGSHWRQRVNWIIVYSVGEFVREKNGWANWNYV